MKKENMMLQVYVDRLSPPCRAILLFCKVNGLEFDEIILRIDKKQHLSPELEEINPLRKLPAMVHGTYKLFESQSILRYLACAFPGIPDHWYPADLFERAKIESVLDWNIANLHPYAGGYVKLTTLEPALGLPMNTQAVVEAEKLLFASLEKIEKVWLTSNGPFLLGRSQPSIADLILVCLAMQLQILHEEDYARIIGPFTKVQKWIEDMKKATSPHFEEVHDILYMAKTKLQKQRSLIPKIGTESSIKNTLPSKI